MSDSPRQLSRRELFSKLFSPLRGAHDAVVLPQSAPPRSEASPESTPVDSGPKVAVIAGRDCLAYHNIPCSVCHQQCPIPGALPMEEGLPHVVLSLCTGCGICHEVCPAPDNAVRMVPAPR